MEIHEKYRILKDFTSSGQTSSKQLNQFRGDLPENGGSHYRKTSDHSSSESDTDSKTTDSSDASEDIFAYYVKKFPLDS